jgi:hypothetical protein
VHATKVALVFCLITIAAIGLYFAAGLLTKGDPIEFGAQALLILIYATSVALFTIGIIRGDFCYRRYFSRGFFLSLLPLVSLAVAAFIRTQPLIGRLHAMANAREVFLHAVMPVFLGAITSIILIVVYTIYFMHLQNKA